MTDYANHPGHRCPTCDSPSPERHPAMAWEGEVELCTDDYHLIRTNMVRESVVAEIMAKRAALAAQRTERAA